MQNKDLRVYKANSIVEASYDLSVSEHRLLFSCFAQIGKCATDQRLYRVYARDIAALSNTSNQDAYRDTAKATERLYERSIKVFSGPNGTTPPKKQKFRWIQEAIYAEGEGYVDIRLSTSILPFVNNLLEQYTVYHLKDVSRMTSRYAIRIFELLIQWRRRGTREVEIEWLRMVLGLDGKYKSFKDFRKHVIEVAMIQINEKSPLEVECSFRKTGRRYSHVEFFFSEKEVPSKSTKPALTKVNPAEKITGTSMFGLSPETIRRYAKEGESWQDSAIRALESKRKTFYKQ